MVMAKNKRRKLVRTKPQKPEIIIGYPLTR